LYCFTISNFNAPFCSKGGEHGKNEKKEININTVTHFHFISPLLPITKPVTDVLDLKCFIIYKEELMHPCILD
jgi:hypothetical protein